jgi:hypothetical protein
MAGGRWAFAGSAVRGGLNSGGLVLGINSVMGLCTIDLHRNVAAPAANGGAWKGLDDLETATSRGCHGSMRPDSNPSSTTTCPPMSKPTAGTRHIRLVRNGSTLPTGRAGPHADKLSVIQCDRQARGSASAVDNRRGIGW